MRELQQSEFKSMSSIKNALTQYSGDFRSRISDEQIQRMSERLTIWKISTLDIESAMESLISRGEEKFPTAQNIRTLVQGKKKADKDASPIRDETVQKDIQEFNKNYADAKRKFGEEVIEKYIDAWLKVFFGGCEDFLKGTNLSRSLFKRLAIKDLKRYGGDFKLALSYAKKEREEQEKKQEREKERLRNQFNSIIGGNI